MEVKNVETETSTGGPLDEALRRALSALLEDLGLSKGKFAKKIDVPLRTVNRYLSGVGTWDLERLGEVSAALGITGPGLLDAGMPRHGEGDESIMARDVKDRAFRILDPYELSRIVTVCEGFKTRGSLHGMLDNLEGILNPRKDKPSDPTAED